MNFDRNVPRKPRHVGGVKGHNIKWYYLSGKPPRACPVLTGWPGSFTLTGGRGAPHLKFLTKNGILSDEEHHFLIVMNIFSGIMLNSKIS